MRDTIYYWKCDRPATLHGVGRDESRASGLSLVPTLKALLAGHFPGVTSLQPAGGKGNHHTYLLDYSGGRAFVRVEDGPERDGHLAMESRVMAQRKLRRWNPPDSPHDLRSCRRAPGQNPPAQA